MCLSKQPQLCRETIYPTDFIAVDMCQSKVLGIIRSASNPWNKVVDTHCCYIHNLLAQMTAPAISFCDYYALFSRECFVLLRKIRGIFSQVLPHFFEPNLSYACSRYIKKLCNSLRRQNPFICANRENLLCCQLACRVALSTGHTLLMKPMLRTVAYIVLRCSLIKMPRIATRRIMTAMANLQAFGQLPMRKLIRYTMGCSDFPLKYEYSIPAGLPTSEPRPAGIFPLAFIHFVPEIFNRISFGYATTLSRTISLFGMLLTVYSKVFFTRLTCQNFLTGTTTPFIVAINRAKSCSIAFARINKKRDVTVSANNGDLGLSCSQFHNLSVVISVSAVPAAGQRNRFSVWVANPYLADDMSIAQR
jgi:hypothetical protein